MDKSKLNFRVKVDLSKIFQDHRSLSWIFVDTAKILNIQHLKAHISKIFDIKEPFFLLCDSTYLPCKEDVRIVQYDNNPLTLVTGASVNNGYISKRECPDGNSLKTNISQINAQASTSDVEKEVQSEKDDQDDLYSSNMDLNGTVLSGKSFPESRTNNTVYHSILEEYEVSSPAESVTKETDNSLITEDSSFNANTPAKRKRTRRKRVKRLSNESLQPNTPKDEQKKPKIIEEVVIKSGKHIRFSNQDEEINSPICAANSFNLKNNVNESPSSKQSPPTNLNALLNLKHCSTPLTFACKKSDKQFKKQKTEIPAIMEVVENGTESGKFNGNGTEKYDTQLDIVNIERSPPLSTKPKVDDLIAFKMLKMGDNYTPQVSAYILGRIVNFDPETALCTIKVLRGVEETQEPQGKLSIPMEEEDASPADLIKLYFNQLLEAKLMFRKD